MEPQKPSLVVPIVSTALISAIIFGTAGYYIANSKNTSSSAATPTPVSTAKTTAKATTATATPTAAPTTNPTANWSTYTNTKYSYSVKYPNSDWYIYDSNGKNSSTLTTTETLNMARTGSQDRSHYIDVSTDSVNTKVDFWANQLKSKKAYTKTTTTIAGKAATQFTYSDETSGKVVSESKVLVFSDGTKTFSLVGTVKDYEKTGGIDAGNFDTILGTFSLTK